MICRPIDADVVSRITQLLLHYPRLHTIDEPPDARNVDTTVGFDAQFDLMLRVWKSCKKYNCFDYDDLRRMSYTAMEQVYLRTLLDEPFYRDGKELTYEKATGEYQLLLGNLFYRAELYEDNPPPGREPLLSVVKKD